MSEVRAVRGAEMRTAVRGHTSRKGKGGPRPTCPLPVLVCMAAGVSVGEKKK